LQFKNVLQRNGDVANCQRNGNSGGKIEILQSGDDTNPHIMDNRSCGHIREVSHINDFPEVFISSITILVRLERKHLLIFVFKTVESVDWTSESVDWTSEIKGQDEVVRGEGAAVAAVDLGEGKKRKGVDGGQREEVAGEAAGESAVDSREREEVAGEAAGDSAVDSREREEVSGEAAGESAVDSGEREEVSGEAAGESAVDSREREEVAGEAAGESAVDSKAREEIRGEREMAQDGAGQREAACSGTAGG
jgi:hypothetical protein